ncbi:MAG: sulfurtransferase TusA family protein, partial [Bacillota bacterium]
MAHKELNCKGLACPQPVLETKKALAELPEGASLTVIVDNPAARENVTLFA